MMMATVSRVREDQQCFSSFPGPVLESESVDQVGICAFMEKGHMGSKVLLTSSRMLSSFEQLPTNCSLGGIYPANLLVQMPPS